MAHVWLTEVFNKALYTGTGCGMTDLLNRKTFMEFVASSAGLVLAGPVGKARAEDIEYVPGLSAADEFSVYRSTGSYNYEGVSVNHLTPGGFVHGDRTFRPEFYIYTMLDQAIERGNVSVRIHPEKASVGFNRSWQSGRFVVLSMPIKYGELRADFPANSTMGGFYDGDRKSTIRNAFDALSIGIEKGKVTMGKQPGSSVPLIEWSLDAIGSMGTGGQVTSSHIRSAVPLAMRFLRSGEEYWVYGNGTVKRSR